MLQLNKNIVIVGLVTVIIYLVAIIAFSNLANKHDFSWEEFDSAVVEFNECYDGDQQDLANKYYHTNLTSFTQVEIQNDFNNNFDTDCSSRFVTSNRDQISEMAMFLVTNIDYKLLDAAYTAPSDYYAILNVPQEYLFFAMSDDKKTISAYVVKRTRDGYEYEQIFISDDIEESQEYTQYLLLMYHEEV